MKILMSCRQHPYHLCGGLSIASWNTAKAARDAGHEVHYITGSRDGPSVTEEEGIRVFWLEGMSHEADGYSRLYQHLTDCKNDLDDTYDVFHSQSSALTPLLDCETPIIFQEHGTMLAAMQDDINMTAFGLPHTDVYGSSSPYPTIYDQFTNFIDGKEIDYLRRFDRVLATSHIAALDLQTRYYLDNVRLMHHCIYDLPAWTNRDAQSPPVVGIFALGLDAPQKSVVFGLRQLLPIKNNISLKIIGKGKTAAAYARHNFPRVEVTGYLEESKAIEALQSVDVLFECSCHHRGCNLTGITALGLGVPIVTYPTGGHMDLIGEEALEKTYGPGGAIVDPFRPGGASEALMKVITERSRFGATARKHFENVFAPEVCALWLNAMYEEVK